MNPSDEDYVDLTVSSDEEHGVNGNENVRTNTTASTRSDDQGAGVGYQEECLVVQYLDKQDVAVDGTCRGCEDDMMYDKDGHESASMGDMKVVSEEAKATAEGAEAVDEEAVDEEAQDSKDVEEVDEGAKATAEDAEAVDDEVQDSKDAEEVDEEVKATAEDAKDAKDAAEDGEEVDEEAHDSKDAEEVDEETKSETGALDRVIEEDEASMHVAAHNPADDEESKVGAAVDSDVDMERDTDGGSLSDSSFSSGSLEDDESCSSGADTVAVPYAQMSILSMSNRDLTDVAFSAQLNGECPCIACVFDLDEPTEDKLRIHAHGSRSTFCKAPGSKNKDRCAILVPHCFTMNNIHRIVPMDVSNDTNRRTMSVKRKRGRAASSSSFSRRVMSAFRRMCPNSSVPASKVEETSMSGLILDLSIEQNGSMALDAERFAFRLGVADLAACKDPRTLFDFVKQVQSASDRSILVFKTSLSKDSNAVKLLQGGLSTTSRSPVCGFRPYPSMNCTEISSNERILEMFETSVTTYDKTLLLYNVE